MTTFLVECLRCGGPRRVEPGVNGRDDPGECTRCHYLGWAPSVVLTERQRRRIRERPPEIRARIQRVA